MENVIELSTIKLVNGPTDVNVLGNSFSFRDNRLLSDTASKFVIRLCHTPDTVKLYPKIPLHALFIANASVR